MIDRRPPRYDCGQQVRAQSDLYNDGSHPLAEAGALLIEAGAVGEIVRVGLHQQANVPVYLVDFIEHRTVLGCLEEELVPL